MEKTLELLMGVTAALQSILDHNLVPEPAATLVRERVKEAGDFINEQLAKQS